MRGTYFIPLLLLVIFVGGCQNQPTSQASSEQAATTPKTAVSKATSNFELYFPEMTVPQEVPSFCLDLKTKGFKDILSMQFSVNWDPKVLKFAQVQKADLPGIGETNFGQHILEQGKLTFLWYDMNLQPRNIPDGGAVFTLCFEPIGEPGSTTKLKISSNPTAKEITNKDREELPLTHAGNTITIIE